MHFLLLMAISLCVDSSLVLTPDSVNYFHQWSTGDTTTSITITPTREGQYTYTCETYRYEILSTNNLMANGDFENYTDYRNPPMGFTSDYEYLPFDPYGTNLYETFPGRSGVYLLSNNANHTWRDYANVSPHGGKFFAMFDAANSGYAWRVSTADNPNMKLQKGGLYLFSYWAADLNKPEQRQHPAELQFTIEYRDSMGVMQKDSLGSVLVLGKDNKWHYSETYWIAPCFSDSIIIGVEDQNDYAGVGNDFGLDDIMFQMVTREIAVSVDKQVFVVDVEDCSPCPDFVYSKWNDVLFADNADSLFVAYRWYRDGVELAGETHQHLYLSNDMSEGEFYCVATRADGTELTSCSHTFDATHRAIEGAKAAPADHRSLKVLRGGSLILLHEGVEYDSHGRRL